MQCYRNQNKKEIKHNFLVYITLVIERMSTVFKTNVLCLLYLWISLTSFLPSIRFCIISWVLHVFWLVLSWNYVLLEDKCIGDITINNFLLLYKIKLIDSTLPLLCTVINHRGCQNVLRTSVTCSTAPSLF